MTTLTDAPLAPLLEQLFTEAETETSPREWVAAAQITPEEHERLRDSSAEADYRKLFSLMRESYLAVSRETAQLLYMLVRSSGARQVVEFGTSFGVSALHLAAGLRDNGGGRVITTELESIKAAQAHENFVAGGLEDLIEIRVGDALATLAEGLPDAIDLVLLDGSKPLYPAVLALLEPHLKVGALLIADNAERSPDYVQHVRSSGAYMSVAAFGDDELTMYVG